MTTPTREKHQDEIARGIKLAVTPALAQSAAWKRVQQAALLDGRTVIELVADGIMAAVEA